MHIDEIRIYAEVLEQWLDFKEYIQRTWFTWTIKNIYTKKAREWNEEDDSRVKRIRKFKDVDVLLTAVEWNDEYPLLMVEYSSAVPTDDHKMQRSDVYFWWRIFKVPTLKISPEDKWMDQDFWWWDKITTDLEKSLSYHHWWLFYYINRDTIDDTDVLDTKPNALSCIYFSQDLLDILTDILNTINEISDYSEYFSSLRSSYISNDSNDLHEYTLDEIKNLFPDSSRFKWDWDKLQCKINRFGHAMDPDRWVLYFVNMLMWSENTITEMQLNRSSIDGRWWYASLFDATANEDEMIRYVTNIINNKNNIFDDNDALYIFSKSLNIHTYDLFTPTGNHKYYIEDDTLANFFRDNPSITSKFIFFLSNKLVLTDKNRDTICEIEWNWEIADEYLNELNTQNFNKLGLSVLTQRESKEDIITYSSIELYKKIRCDLIAASYPWAQWDRCILTWNGRTVLRDYVDIIAYNIDEETSNVTVFLEECKDKISKSPSDVQKLHTIIDSAEKRQWLRDLIEKTKNITEINDIKISVWAQLSPEIPTLDVDYIFMFSIWSDNWHTIVDYVVALIDTDLMDLFSPLMDSSRRLKWKLILDQIYTIND